MTTSERKALWCYSNNHKASVQSQSHGHCVNFPGKWHEKDKYKKGAGKWEFGVKETLFRCEPTRLSIRVGRSAITPDGSRRVGHAEYDFRGRIVHRAVGL